MKDGLTRRSLLGAAALTPLPSPAASTVEVVHLVHHTHADFGYTDLPSVCRDLLVRYLDAALDLCLRDPRFVWTAEVMANVTDWWAQASSGRRSQLLEIVRSGRMEVGAMPFSQAPFHSAAQWGHLLNWAPPELWRALRPRMAMQNDVNGFPRAGAAALLGRGVCYLWMGINPDSGGSPFPQPSAFWWRMKDGRRIFVWCGIMYGHGFQFFQKERWFVGPVARTHDGSFPIPRRTNFLRTAPAALNAAHAQCLARLREVEAAGYRLHNLPVSISYDNAPPVAVLPDFVEAWNKLGLKPSLRLTTASAALDTVVAEAGAGAPVIEGEWPDWWANGAASAPRETAANRHAKHFLAAAASPVWKSPFQPPRATLDDLCFFDEHTWGSSDAAWLPDSFDAAGQLAEKQVLAFRSLAHSQWLVSRQARTLLAGRPKGLYVVNPASQEYSGWVALPAHALLAEHRSLRDYSSNKALPLYRLPDLQWARPEGPENLAGPPAKTSRQSVRFWADRLAPHSVTSFQLLPTEAAPPAPAVRPSVTPGPLGWPASVHWPNAPSPLFTVEQGDFIAYRIRDAAPRLFARKVAAAQESERQAMLRSAVEPVPARYHRALVEMTPYSLIYQQTFEHPSLAWGIRTLELWNAVERACLTLRLYRRGSREVELYYSNFQFPSGAELPTLSNGGLAFIPFIDQLPGTCMDYFAIDGWALYRGTDGGCLWASRDAPLVSIGGPHPLYRIRDLPKERNRLSCVLFDNTWYTNFPAQSSGAWEYQFDLLRLPSGQDAAVAAGALSAGPVVVLDPPPAGDAMLDSVFRP